MTNRSRRRAVYIWVAGVFLCLTLIIGVWQVAPFLARFTDERLNDERKPERPEARAKSDTASIGGNSFFERKSRAEMAAARSANQTNNPAASSSWFKDEPILATAATNVFTVGSRTARIVSQKPVNEEAVYQFLTKQVETDKITDSRLLELRQAAARLKPGMLGDEVIKILGGVPTSQTSLNDRHFMAYSTHPSKLRSGPGDNFLVLYLDFDSMGKLEKWRFRRP